MTFFKKNIWTICSWAAVIAFTAVNPAFADQGSSLMATAQTKASNVFQSVKTITFILGGFGLVGVAYQALLGKMKWSWVAALAVGLALLAAAGAIVEYATGDSVNDKFADTFGTGSNY